MSLERDMSRVKQSFTLMVVVLVDPSSTKEEWTRTVIQCFPRALLESQAIFQTVCEIRTRCYSK